MSEHLLGVHDLSEDAYRLAAGISKSMLDHIAPPKTPAHFRAYCDAPQKPPTPAQKFGTVVHAAILQPDRKDLYAVNEEGLKLSTKAGMEWKVQQGGKLIVDKEDGEAIAAIRANAWAHPVAGAILRGSDAERAIFAEDSHGTLRKGRIDLLPRSGNVIADIKTCASAAPEEFEKFLYDWGGYRQAPFYLDLCALAGMEFEKFLFIACEKEPPYLVAVYELDPVIVEAGRKCYQRDLALYRHCQETGKWPGYDESPSLVGVPHWARKELEALV